MGFSDNAPTGQHLSTPAGRLDLLTGELSFQDPRQWDGRMTTVVPGDPGRCPHFLRWLYCRVTRRPASLQWFVHWALRDHPGGGAVRRLLLRGAIDSGDLMELVPIFQATIGDYAGSLDYDTWSRWPKGRTAELGQELSGRRLLFLVGQERYARLPHQALSVLLTHDRVEFWEQYRGWQAVPTPRYFLLPGGAGRKADQRFEAHVDRLTETLPPPDEHASPPLPPGEFLPEEAPHILAWFLAKPGTGREASE